MERIALRTQFSTGVNWGEVREVLSSALRNETELANARRTYFERACHAFEQQYQISSEEFMQQFESGALGDDADYFDWYAAKRGLGLCELCRGDFAGDAPGDGG